MNIILGFAKHSVAALSASLFLTVGAQADEIADSYKGKTINVFVGSGPGGGYGTYARMMGRHLGRHIPGHPDFLVKNMDGAGSIIAANYVCNVAPQDGTAIAALQRNAAIVRIMGQKGPQIEATKFNRLGSFNDEVGIMAVAKRTGITKFEDLYERKCRSARPAPRHRILSGAGRQHGRDLGLAHQGHGRR